VEGLVGLSPFLILFVSTALLYGFLNGFQGSANAVATLISSRAMRPREALALSAAAHLVGPFLFGVAVATTIGHDVIAEQVVALEVVLAALLAAICRCIVSLLVEAVWEIHLGVLRLTGHPAVAGDRAVRAKALGNRVERVCREAPAAL